MNKARREIIETSEYRCVFEEMKDGYYSYRFYYDGYLALCGKVKYKGDKTFGTSFNELRSYHESLRAKGVVR